MSFFKKKKENVPTTEEAIQKLLETEEMLQKQSDFMEKKIADQLQLAKKYGTKNKTMALKALKRKKRFEKQLQQIDGTMLTLELQREALQAATSNIAVMKVMTDAVKSLEKAHNYLDPDKIHDLMGEIEDQQLLSEEIGDLMSKPIGFGQDEDDDELLAELEDIEQNELEEQLLDIKDPCADSLPTAPAKPSMKEKKQEIDELKELAEWAT